MFTSNVDGHFQRAGFDSDQVVECHGSLNHLQCLAQCSSAIWRMDEELEMEMDESTMEAVGSLPACRDCGALARPNVLMFGDFGWNEGRTSAQEARFRDWLHEVGDASLVLVEIGAGRAVPTVRRMAVTMAGEGNAALIRINPREPEVPDDLPRAVGIAGGALDVLLRMLPDQRTG